MPGSENGTAPAIALGAIDVAQPAQSSLPAQGPAVIFVVASGVPLGRVEIAAGKSVSALTIAAGLSDALIERALLAGLSASVAHGVPDGSIDVATALDALSRPSPAPPSIPTITVAICTRDRERQLERAIASVVDSLGTGDELVVIDNASTVDLAPLVRRFRAVRLIREDRPGLDWARNRAILESRGDVIAFCDDDCVMLPATLPALRFAFSRNPDVDAITGLVEPLMLHSYAQALCDRYLSSDRWYQRRWVKAPHAGTVAREVGNVGRYGNGASLALRRALFDRIGVFDAALGPGSQCRAGDDMEFFFRLLKSGAMLLREPRVSVRHDHRLELAELEAQFEAWSGGFACAVHRSMLAFPEERVPYTILLARIAVLYHARRAVMHPQLRPIAMAELRGMFGARRRYAESRRTAEHVARTIPSPAVDAPPVPRRSPRANRQGPVAQHSLDLADARAALHVGPEYARVSLSVTNRGQSLGTLFTDVVNGWVGADRLCDTIAAQFGPRVLGTTWPAARAQARDLLGARIRGVLA